MTNNTKIIDLMIENIESRGLENSSFHDDKIKQNSTKTWQERLWDRFKSPLGYSSIDNKNNSMYDLEKFITDLISKTREEIIREVENVLYEAMDMGYSKRDIIDKINKLKK